MSEERIKLRWLSYVVRGEGKARSDSNERFTYRGPVLYSNDYPVARLIKAPGRDWVCVSRTGTRPHAPRDWDHDGKPTMTDTVIVPCVGVFSQYDGDMMDDVKLHERIKWLSHCEAQSLIEKAQVWPADKLLVKPKWRHGTGAEQLKVDLRTLINRYTQYSAAFKLGWGEFPTHYTIDLNRSISLREEAYNDPKTVAQRVRQIARREAKEALGV